MQHVKVNKYQVALVFRNNAYVKALTEGKYWLRLNDQVLVYDKSKSFTAPCDLNILMNDATLTGVLDVIVIKDNQVAVLRENGLFKAVLPAGRYSMWKGIVERECTIYDLNQLYVPEEVIQMLMLNSTELSSYIRVYSVASYEKGLLFINGKLEKELDAGTYHFWKNAQTVDLLKADTRQLQLEVNGQEILTSDKATLRLNFVAHYKITDAQKALMNNKDHEKQLYVLLQLAYREYISNMRFDELLEKKEAVADYVKETVAARFEQLGTQLINTGIRDVILPGEVKDIMNQVLVAEKRAQANIIMRREETASTRSLLNTAKLMEENQMLFRLKEMEYVEKIAEKINSISVSGDNGVLNQFRQIFIPAK